MAFGYFYRSWLEEKMDMARVLWYQGKCYERKNVLLLFGKNEKQEMTLFVSKVELFELAEFHYL